MNVRAALELCASERAPSAYSCAAVMVAAAPASSMLAKAYDVFEKLPSRHKVRSLRNVEGGARVVARAIGAERVASGGEQDAWGVVRGGEGRVCFAFRSAGIWYARSNFGLMKMHISTVIKAWELI